MSATFDVNQYWLKRGQTYIQEKRLSLDYHRIQEQFLFDVLSEGSLPMNRILELGCGFGRITKLLAEKFPKTQITAVDLSPDQLANAQRLCGDSRNITFLPYDFYSESPLPPGKYDAMIAVEVFLHHPRSLLVDLVKKIRRSSRLLVNIDWSEDWPWRTPEHVWLHDYAALYRELGLQCSTFCLPEKVEGMQQKLFIAARRLPVELVRSEKDWAEARQTKLASSDVVAPEPVWSAQVDATLQGIRENIPPGSTVILVNDDQWEAQRPLVGYRVLPFLEWAGQYWGPPADDEGAICELNRLRQAGASYLIVAWNSFWWLEHYTGFRKHLQSSHSCVASNNSFIIFKLK